MAADLLASPPFHECESRSSPYLLSVAGAASLPFLPPKGPGYLLLPLHFCFSTLHAGWWHSHECLLQFCLFVETRSVLKTWLKQIVLTWLAAYNATVHQWHRFSVLFTRLDHHVQGEPLIPNSQYDLELQEHRDTACLLKPGYEVMRF